jgi:hypothetical protein
MLISSLRNYKAHMFVVVHKRRNRLLKLLSHQPYLAFRIRPNMKHNKDYLTLQHFDSYICSFLAFISIVFKLCNSFVVFISNSAALWRNMATRKSSSSSVSSSSSPPSHFLTTFSFATTIAPTIIHRDIEWHHRSLLPPHLQPLLHVQWLLGCLFRLMDVSL